MSRAGQFTAEVQVKSSQAGIVYGAKGSFKASVEEACGVSIEKIQDRDHRTAKFEIKGSPGACDRARQMIQERVSAVISSAGRFRNTRRVEPAAEELGEATTTKTLATGVSKLGGRFASLVMDGEEEETKRGATGGKHEAAVAKHEAAGSTTAEAKKVTLFEYLSSGSAPVLDAGVSAKRARQIQKRGVTFELHAKPKIGQLKFQNWKAHMDRLERATAATDAATEAVETNRGIKRTHDEAFPEKETEETNKYLRVEIRKLNPQAPSFKPAM